MTRAMRRNLEHIAIATGATGFAVVREGRHLIVDFSFPNRTKPARVTLSASPSDGRRAYQNQLGDVRRAARGWNDAR